MEHVAVAVPHRTGRAHRRGGGIYPLLFLPPVAEPHSYHLLFHAQPIGQHCDLLRRRFRVLDERLFQSHPHAGLYGGPLLPPPPDGLRRCHGITERSGISQSAVGVFQPLLKQRFQLAHILEAQIQRFEPGYRRLGEVVAVELSHR